MLKMHYRYASSLIHHPNECVSIVTAVCRSVGCLVLFTELDCCVIAMCVCVG